MAKLPILSGHDVVSALERLGFQQTGQRGSHVKLRRSEVTCIVPLHRELKRGTLAGVLRQARLTADDLAKALTH